MTTQIDPQRLALMLEKFTDSLDALPPDTYAALIAELDRADPAGRAQSHAAQRDMCALVEALAGARGPSGHVPGWAKLGALETYATWVLGRSRTCRHNPRPERPQPVFSCAWRPDLVVCGACTHLLQAANSVEDATCDACGHLCAGPEAGDPIHQQVTGFATLAVLAGVCTRCRDEATNA